MAPEIGRATLREILADNAGTEFGRTHHFDALQRDPAAWRRAVPLLRHDDLAPAIDRMARGEPNVLVAERVDFFARTSGSTGTGNLIPTPPKHQATFTRYYAGIIPAVPTLGVPGGDEPHPGLALIGAGGQHRTPAGIPVGSASTGGLRRVRRFAELLWTSPWPVFEVDDISSQWYLHALFALRERSTRFLWGVFAPHLLEWVRMLEVWQEDLVRDLADGRIGRELVLDPVQRAAIAARLRPDPTRAREVAAAFACGDAAYVRRVWPRLRYAMAVITGGFAAYLPRLRLALGDLPIYTSCYSASEAIIGLNLEIDRPERYVLTPGTAHFEFIPLGAATGEQPETVGVEALEVGAHYEVVLTNRGGLYRYRLRDVVRVEGWHERAPVLSFAWRQGTVLDLVGEHSTEVHLLAAVEQASARLVGRADALVDFTVHGDSEAAPPRYVVYVELEGQVDAGALARAVELELGEQNPLFVDYRRGDRIGPPAVRLLPTGSFRALAQWRLARANGVSAVQLKPARRVLDVEMLRWLDAQASCSTAPGVTDRK
ncbi:MAG: GH3 auxin-responsive promoter family protein [Nannocystis sp.]|nr:GH3 auxin-responsive promoter family protein [Nannocystis sp.]